MKITRSDVKQILENPEIKAACEKVAYLEYGFPTIYSMRGILCYALGVELSETPDSYSSMYYQSQMQFDDPNFVDIYNALNELKKLINKIDIYRLINKKI